MSRSRAFASLTLAAAIAVSAAAAADATSHEKAVQRHFELIDMPAQVTTSVRSIMALQIAQNPGLRPYAGTIEEFLAKHIGWEAMKGDLTDMYMQAFTEKELKQINDFYSSKPGQKLIQQVPELVQQRNTLTMQRIESNISELQQSLQAAQEERMQEQGQQEGK